MNDHDIEMRTKGAPRVTPADIEVAIIAEHYFTAAEGMGDKPYHPSLNLLTFCVLVLRNGFTVTGESACASPENFDPEVGRAVARNHAVQKIWLLEGYLLKERLYERSKLGSGQP